MGIGGVRHADRLRSSPLGVCFSAVCTIVIFAFVFICSFVGNIGSDGSPRCLDEGDGGGLHPGIGSGQIAGRRLCNEDSFDFKDNLLIAILERERDEGLWALASDKSSSLTDQLQRSDNALAMEYAAVFPSSLPCR